MNRAEFSKLLDDVCREIGEEGGNFDEVRHDKLRSEDIRTIAAVALLAADRYYSNLNRLLSERKEL